MSFRQEQNCSWSTAVKSRKDWLLAAAQSTKVNVDAKEERAKEERALCHHPNAKNLAQTLPKWPDDSFFYSIKTQNQGHHSKCQQDQYSTLSFIVWGYVHGTLFISSLYEDPLLFKAKLSAFLKSFPDNPSVSYYRLQLPVVHS